MKKEQNETKKPKSLMKKAKKIRSMVMMVLLCVMMMSAATYAWFTLSNTAKASNLTMTVGDTSGLQIAPDVGGVAGTFGSSIKFQPVNGKLLPTTTENGKDFKIPKYDGDGAVTGFETSAATGFDGNTVASNDESTSSGNSTDGYFIKYEFWLKSLGSDSTVKLAPGSGMDSANGKKVEGCDGTYILSDAVDNEPTKAVPGSAAVRLCFVPGAQATSSAKAVFEPNSDLTNTGFSLAEGTDYAKTADSFSLTPISSTIQHKANGSVVDDVNGNVISLTADKATKVTLYVWIEGTDAQCVNQIAAKDIIGQLVFTNAD